MRQPGGQTRHRGHRARRREDLSRSDFDIRARLVVTQSVLEFQPAWSRLMPFHSKRQNACHSQPGRTPVCSMSKASAAPTESLGSTWVAARSSAGNRDRLPRSVASPAAARAAHRADTGRSLSTGARLRNTFRFGSTPMPTCLPGQGGSRKRMWFLREQPSGQRRPSPTGGFFVF